MGGLKRIMDAWLKDERGKDEHRTSNIQHPSEILLRRAAEQHFTGQVEHRMKNRGVWVAEILTPGTQASSLNEVRQINTVISQERYQSASDRCMVYVPPVK
jgi:hypothetical protein